jgi:hypothetical protein
MLTGSIKISELNSLSTITWGDFFPLVQSSSLTTFRVNLTTLEAWLSVSGSVISASWASASLTSVETISASWASASISSSYSGVALSASYAPFTQAFQATASFATSSISASYALSASYAPFTQTQQSSCSYAPASLSASYALSASWAPVLGDTVPIGTILAYSGNTLPANWLECNGDAKITSSFIDLYNAIKTTSISASYGYLCDSFGNRNSAGAFFKIPDLRGEFLRGWDHNRGIDLGRSSGSFQNSSLGGHFHGIGDWSSPSNDDMFFITRNWGDGTTYTERFIEGQSGANTTRPVVTPASGQAAATTGPMNGVGDTYPRNIAMMYCIKYSNTTNFAVSGVSLAGDVIGNTAATNVVAIQNVPVTSSAPMDGQYLVYSATAGKWLPTSFIPAAGGPHFITPVQFASVSNINTGWTTHDTTGSGVPSTATTAIIQITGTTGGGPISAQFRSNVSGSAYTYQIGALGGGDIAFQTSQQLIPLTTGAQFQYIVSASGGTILLSLIGYI